MAAEFFGPGSPTAWRRAWAWALRTHGRSSKGGASEVVFGLVRLVAQCRWWWVTDRLNSRFLSCFSTAGRLKRHNGGRERGRGTGWWRQFCRASGEALWWTGRVSGGTSSPVGRNFKIGERSGRLATIWGAKGRGNSWKANVKAPSTAHRRRRGGLEHWLARLAGRCAAPRCVWGTAQEVPPLPGKRAKS